MAQGASKVKPHPKVMTPNEANASPALLYKHNRNKYPHLEPNDPRLYMTPEQVLKNHLDLNKNCMDKPTLAKFWPLVLCNTDSFSLYDEVGTCPYLTVKIKLTDETPFFIRP